MMFYDDFFKTPTDSPSSQNSKMKGSITKSSNLPSRERLPVVPNFFQALHSNNKLPADAKKKSSSTAKTPRLPRIANEEATQQPKTGYAQDYKLAHPTTGKLKW